MSFDVPYQSAVYYDISLLFPYQCTAETGETISFN
jgi:hypothetical protein